VELLRNLLNNSTNINKTHNHLSPQQFHQYQQNKQSPLTSTIPSISTKQTITSHLNNSTNINKTINHLSPQQFHQYQQNKQSPLTSTIPSISTKQIITSHLNKSTNINKTNNHLSPREVIVCFVDIGGIVEVRGDCLFC
jgi:nucleoid-associated protein YejK